MSGSTTSPTTIFATWYSRRCADGDHIQDSVFRCDLSERERVALIATLHALIEHAEDQILLSDLGPVDGRGANCVTAIGRRYLAPEPDRRGDLRPDSQGKRRCASRRAGQLGHREPCVSVCIDSVFDARERAQDAENGSRRAAARRGRFERVRGRHAVEALGVRGKDARYASAPVLAYCWVFGS